MWQLVLKAQKEFKFPARASSRDFYGTIIVNEQQVKNIINLIKSSEKFVNKNAALDFFGSINDEEEYVEDYYQYLWDEGGYEIEDLTKNLKMLKDTVLDLVNKETSRLQSERAKNPRTNKRMVWRARTWEENQRLLEEMIDNGDTGSLFKESIQSLNSFIEDEKGYTKANPINPELKKKLLIALKGKDILISTDVEIEMKVKGGNAKNILSAVESVYTGWEVKSDENTIRVKNRLVSDNVNQELQQLLQSLSEKFEELQIEKTSIGYEQTLIRSALAQHLGNVSSSDIQRLTIDNEKEYRVNQIGVPQVRTYIYQFLNSQYISKNINELLPGNIHGYTGSLLGEIFVKRTSGNRPRLNRYLDVLLDNELEGLKGDKLFEEFRQNLKNRMFISDDKLMTDFVRDISNIFLLSKDKGNLIARKKREESSEQVVARANKIKDKLEGSPAYQTLLENPMGLTGNETPKKIQQEIGSLISGGSEEWTGLFNQYKSDINSSITDAVNNLSEPMMAFLVSLAEQEDNYRRISRWSGLEQEELEHIKDNSQVKKVKKEIEVGNSNFTIVEFVNDKSNKIAKEFVKVLREGNRASKEYRKFKRENPKFKSMNVQEDAINFLYDARGYQTPSFGKTETTEAFNQLTSLQKGLAAIIYERFESDKSIAELFDGKVKHSSKQMDFLELIHVIANADGDLGEKGRFNRVWSSIDSAISKVPKEDREDYILTSDGVPFIREIKLFANKIIAALSSIKQGLMQVVENKLEDMVNNQPKYEKLFNRTIREKGGQKRIKLYFKVYDRLEELGLISEV